ncbi:uncharacterized protein [Pagrus major]|uniref:uncharacterized protein n=1 Tax=Pagrus major TaxID=143350 RepID=UPI003CC84597
MKNLTGMTALLLCSLSWISVSVSDSQTVEVQTGDDVSLLCSNFSSSPTQIIWFRVVKRSLPCCISHMFKVTEPATLCDGFQSGKFEMSSNISILFLKIKQVDSSDSGLYFCGYTVARAPLIVSATYLEVQEVFDGTTGLTSAILGGLTVFLMMVVICLAVKIRKLQKGGDEQQPPGLRNKASEEGTKNCSSSNGHLSLSPETPPKAKRSSNLCAGKPSLGSPKQVRIKSQWSCGCDMSI